MDNPTSEFPPLSQLVRSFESWTREESSRVDFERELEQFLTAVANVELNFRQEFPYRAHEAEFAKIGAELEMTLVLIGVQSQELREVLNDDPCASREQLSYLKTSTDKMQSSVSRLQNLVDQEEKFSESPYVHELIRVAYAVLGEQLPLEALQNRLDGYQMVLQQSLLEFENSESELTESDKLVVAESTQLLESGLEMAYQFLADPQADEILEEGLASLEEAAYLLLELSRDLKSKAVALRERACHRCGQVNLATNKLCAHCGVKLIATIDEARPGFDFTMGPDGQIRSGQSTPNLLDSIIEACESRLSEGHSAPGLQKSIGELQRKLHRLRYPVSRMSKLKVDLVEDLQLEVKESAEALLELLEETQEDLSNLRRALRESDKASLVTALSSFKESAELFFQEQTEWDALNQRILES